MKVDNINRLRGTVVYIEEGVKNGVVQLAVGDGNLITSVLPQEEIKALGLEIGKPAYALTKANTVKLDRCGIARHNS